MSSQTELEQDRLVYQEQLDLVVAQLKDDTDNVELQSLKAELEQMISLLDESLAELKPKESQPASQPAAGGGFKKVVSAPSDQPASALTAQEDEAVTYQVNDTVSARWVSGDRGWYPARITSITGSTTAPVYTVKFKSYDTTDTVRARDIRPINNKRKADGISTGPDHTASGSTTAPASGASTPAVATASTFSPIPNARGSAASAGTVVSAAASVYPEQIAKMKAQQETLDGEVKPKKAKKIKANKELEAGKSKWQEFSTKSKFAKTQKKDSMFRTPDGINGRVGFTGSGKAMRKDTARTRHVYQPTDDLD